MRKKFTMLLAALLAFVGVAKAQTLISDATQLSNEKVYTVKAANNASTGAWSVAADGSKMRSTRLTGETPDGNTLNQRFAFLEYDGHVYLYSLGAKKFVKDDGEGQSLTETISSSHYVTFAASNVTPDDGHSYTQAEYPMVVYVGGAALCSSASWWHDTYGGIVTNWNSKGDSGNAVAIVEHEPSPEELALLAEGYGMLATVDLTINYSFDGEEVGNQVFKVQPNTAFSVPALDYTKIKSCKIGEAEQTVTDGACTITVPGTATTITVELETNFPFTVSTDYENAIWYAMQIRGNKYVVRSEAAPYANTTATPTTADALWAFVGNPFDGIQVLNKAAGAGYTLGYDEIATTKNIYMKEGTTTWNIQKGNGGFVLCQDASKNEYIHDYGSKLQYWVDGGAKTDVGSAFVVTSEADMISLATTAMDLASKLDTYAEASYYTYPNAAVAEAKATLQGVAEPTDFLTALNAKAKAEAAQKILNDAGKSGAPVAGDFIILKNKGKNEYMTTMESGDEVYRTSDKNNPKALWKVVAGDDSKVKLYNVASEKYLGALTQSAKVLMVDEANAAQFTFSNVADVYAAFTSGGGQYTYAHMDGWYDRVVGWEAVSDASQWIVSNVRPLSVVYKFNDEVLSETTEYVEYGTVYTVSSPYTFTKPGVCTKNDGALEAVDGVFSFEVTEATTLIVELADALPFKTTTITEGQFAANTEWYVLRQGSNSDSYYWVYDAEGSTTKVAVSGLVNGYDIYDDTQLWCFTGNAIDGVKIFNKSAGTTMSLDNSVPATLVADNAAVWEVYNSDRFFTVDDIRFALGRPGKTGQSQFANYQDGTLKAWTLDAGSTTNAISVSAELAEIASLKAQLFAQITKVTVLKELVGTASAETLTTAITTAQAVYDNNQAYKNEVEDQIAALTAAADAVRYITNLDDLKNTVSYTVYADTRGAWYSEDERLNSTHEMSVAYSTEDTNQQFAFLKSANTGKYYLYSVAKGKFVKGTEKNDKGNAYTALTETPEEFISFLNGTNAEGAFLWVVALNGNKHIGVSTGFSPDVITHYNATGDQGNKLRLEVAATFNPADALAKIEAVEAAAAKVELAARIAEATELAEKSYINAEAKAALTAAKETAQGVYDDATATYAAVSTQITALTDAILAAGYVTTVEEFSNEAVYTFLSMRSEKAYMMYDGTNDFVASQFKQTELEVGADKVNCQWAVYKSTRGNYYMYNLGAQKFMGTTTEHNTGIPFSATPQTTDLKFKVSAQPTHPIMISANGGNGAVNHSNNNGFTDNYGVVNWNTGFGETSDKGNVHKVAIVGTLDSDLLTEISATVEFFEAVNALELAVTDAARLVDSNSDALGFYSSDEENLSDRMTELFSFQASVTEDTPIATIEEYTSKAKDIIASFTLNLPEAGKFYRFSYDYGTDGVKYVQAVASNVEGKANAMVMTEEQGAASIFYYADGKLLSYSAGQYVNESGDTRGLQAVGATAGAAKFEKGSVIGKLYIFAGDSFHANESDDVCFIDHCGDGHPDQSEDKHNFTVEEVTTLPVAVTAAGYATLYAPVALEIPAEGVKVYTAKVTENSVVITEMGGNVIPANTGVILEADENTYNFNVTTAAAVEGVSSDFVGSYAKSNMKDGVKTYTLQNGTNGVGFYRFKGTKAINGFRAWVELPEESEVQSLRITRGDDSTGIENVESNEELVIYDLAGRRVQKMEKGIYIVNGKKVVIK